MLISFGNNHEGQCGINDINNPTEIKETSYFINKVVKVVCSDNRTIILDDEGQLSIMGDISILPKGMAKIIRGTESNSRRFQLNFKEQFEQEEIEEFHRVKDVATTSTMIMIICEHGNIYQIHESCMAAVGFFKKEALKEKYINVMAGVHHFVFLTASNKIYSIFGSNESMGLGNDASLPTNMLVHSPLPEKIDGKLPIKKVVCGLDHTMVLANDGTVYATGQNDRGQLGFGNNFPIVSAYRQLHPELFSKVPIIDIATGDAFSIFLTEEHSVYVVGDNSSNQLGFEWQRDQQEYTPLKLKPIIFNEKKINNVYAAGKRSFFKAVNDMYWACGDNENGQLGVTSILNEPQELMIPMHCRVEQFAISREHSFLVGSTNIDSSSDISVGNPEEARLLLRNQNLSRDNKKMKKDLDRLNTKQKEYVKTNVSLKFEVNNLRKMLADIRKENEKLKDLMNERHVSTIEDQMKQFQAQSEATIKQFQAQMESTLKQYQTQSDQSFEALKGSVDVVRDNRSTFLDKWAKDHQTREDIEATRGRIVREMLANDRRFAKDMRDVVKEFILPLKEAHPESYPDCFNKILAMEKLSAHLADQLAHTLYEWLMGNQSQYDMESRLAEYYVVTGHTLKLFIDYMAVLPKIQLVSKEKVVQEFIVKVEKQLKASATDAHDKIKFNSFCIAPTQQSVQYSLFLNRLIEKMDSEDPLQQMLEAKEALRDIGLYNNRLLAEYEKTQLLTDLRNTVGSSYDMEQSELILYEPKSHRTGIALDAAGVSITDFDPNFHTGDHIPCRLYVLSNMIVFMDSHHHRDANKKKKSASSNSTSSVLLKSNGEPRSLGSPFKNFVVSIKHASTSSSKSSSNQVPQTIIIIPISQILNFSKESDFEFVISYSHSEDDYTTTTTQTVTVPHRGTVDRIKEMVAIYDTIPPSASTTTPATPAQPIKEPTPSLDVNESSDDNKKDTLDVSSIPIDMRTPYNRSLPPTPQVVSPTTSSPLVSSPSNVPPPPPPPPLMDASDDENDDPSTPHTSSLPNALN